MAAPVAHLLLVLPLCSGVYISSHVGHLAFPTYESNLPFALRFMVDKELKGMSWITLPKAAYQTRIAKAKVHIERCGREQSQQERREKKHQNR